MIIEERQRTEYVLVLDYVEVHDLYHMMLEMDRSPHFNLNSTEQRFFECLKEHA